MKSLLYYITIMCFLATAGETVYAQNTQTTSPIKKMQESTFQRIFTKIQEKTKIGQTDEEKSAFDTPPARNPFIAQLPQKPPKPPTPTGTRPKYPPRPTNYLRKPPPTPPPKKVPIKPPELKISGLIWNSKRPQAIINDRVVDEGDTIEKSTIKKIKKDGVVILYADKEFNIPYNQ